MTQPQIVLFNSGKNIITGEYIQDGQKYLYKLIPNKAGCFPKHEADKLKRLFADVLIDEADARAKFSPAAVMAEAQRDAEFAKATASAAQKSPAVNRDASPVTEEDKDRIRAELTAVLVRMQDRGMSIDEVNAIASQAQISATMKKQMENEAAANNPLPAAKDEAAESVKVQQDPDITEEESEAALAAIQAVRAKNAAANPDAPQNQPASIMQRVRDALAGKESA